MFDTCVSHEDEFFVSSERRCSRPQRDACDEFVNPKIRQLSLSKMLIEIGCACLRSYRKMYACVCGRLCLYRVYKLRYLNKIGAVNLNSTPFLVCQRLNLWTIRSRPNESKDILRKPERADLPYYPRFLSRDVKWFNFAILSLISKVHLSTTLTNFGQWFLLKLSLNSFQMDVWFTFL